MWLQKGKTFSYRTEKHVATEREKMWLQKGKTYSYRKEKCVATERRNV
jgi:hypothetical protein